MASKRNSIACGLILAGIALLLVVGLVKTSGSNPIQISLTAEPPGVMGTRAKLIALVPADRQEEARAALGEAERRIRRVEALMSSYLDASDISALNSAPAGELVPLRPETLEVLRTARRMHTMTDGAFDVTIRPLIQVWKQAGKDNRIPGSDALAEARQASSWEVIELKPTGAIKELDTAQVDLGGLAKGYAIDEAVDALQAAGVPNGLVDIGGDIRCLGERRSGGPWRVGVQDPFEDGRTFATLHVSNAAVCTSGNYRRFNVIDGERYSHILDPRTGMPVDAVPSVTVVAPRAITADAWATALSVLGETGLELIEAHDGIEAMIVTGGDGESRARQTSGFGELLRPPGIAGRSGARPSSVTAAVR